MKKSLHLINFIPLLSIPAAIFLSPLGRVFSPFTMWILGALLFFSFLGLKFDQLLKASRKPMQPFFISLVILIVTPLKCYFLFFVRSSG